MFVVDCDKDSLNVYHVQKGLLVADNERFLFNATKQQKQHDF